MYNEYKVKSMENKVISLNENSLIASNEVTPELFNSYINYLDVSEKTLSTYTRALKQFNYYLLENNIKKPSREDVINFREELKQTGHKPTTIQNYIIAIRLFFNWTSQYGYYPNITDHLKGAKISREHKKDYLTPTQIKEVLNSIDLTSKEGLRDYAIISLMVTGGLRTIEVVRANIGDFKPLGNDMVLYVQGKGREEKAEYIKIAKPVEKAIHEYLSTRKNKDNEMPLFVSISNNSSDKRLSTRSVSGIAKKYMVQSGYDSPRLTAHSLRHSAVTISLMANKDIREVQQFARHKNIATTLIYDHALEMAKNTCNEAIANKIF